jgi:hypothetical protein
MGSTGCIGVIIDVDPAAMVLAAGFNQPDIVCKHYGRDHQNAEHQHPHASLPQGLRGKAESVRFIAATSRRLFA